MRIESGKPSFWTGAFGARTNTRSPSFENVRPPTETNAPRQKVERAAPPKVRPPVEPKTAEAELEAAMPK